MDRAKRFGVYSKGHRESWKHFKQESDVVRFLFALVPLGVVHKMDCGGEVGGVSWEAVGIM